MYNALRRFGVPERDLEDVLHDTFVKVSRRLSDYDPSRPLRPWLAAFAFRTASDYRRRLQNRNELVVLDPPTEPDEAPLPDELLEKRRARALVLLALEAVKMQRRAVFVMHDLDGIAVPEIAASLDIPLNTAYSRLRLARNEFTAAVKRIQLKRGAA